MEFGSDFHLIDNYKGNNIPSYFRNANLYASGRQALKALAITRNWRRLWVPSYFCKESLHCLSNADITLIEYPCIPTDNLESTINAIPADKHDGILVVNYFGLNEMCKFKCCAEIVEDHTHDLLGNWCRNSEADWCIASLRKTLPLADGGILWSPKGFALPSKLSLTYDVESAIKKRYEAMTRKKNYLEGATIDKSEYLTSFIETEEEFDSFNLSGISNQSLEILLDFDMQTWYNQKMDNYRILKNALRLTTDVSILQSEIKNGTIFSLILIFKDKNYRDRVRRGLIEQSVYPAILWNLETSKFQKSRNFGDTMLSIHCDGRYNMHDMSVLANIINNTLMICK